MKREFLKGLGIEGLSDEVIDKIMTENGKDIEKQKQLTEKSDEKIKNLESEIETKDKTLTDATAQIEKFKGMDVEGIKKAADDWETKFKESQLKAEEDRAKAAQQLEEKDYEFAVKDFVGQHKFSNDFVKDAFVQNFKTQGFKLDNGKFLGADDYVKTFGEKNPGVFAVEEVAKDTTTNTNNNQFPQIVKPIDGSQAADTTKGFGFNFVGVRSHGQEQK